MSRRRGRLSQFEKKLQQLTDAAQYCKHCGHSLILGTQDKVICNHCGHYVFKDEKIEFMHRMKERMIKRKRENK